MVPKKKKNKSKRGYIKLFWIFPKLTLLYLTIVEVAIYFDRGAVAAVLPKIKANWHLRREEEGAIASIFTVGFMIASPLWAHFGMRYKLNRVIAIGLFVFSIGCACTATLPIIARGYDNKWGYYVFCAFRFLTGVGEAGIISLGYTIVDDLAPIEYKTIYMAIIMMSTPLGVAAGIGITGFIAETQFWESVFFIEAAIVSLAAVLCLRIPFHGYRKKIQVLQTDKSEAQEKSTLCTTNEEFTLLSIEKTETEKDIQVKLMDTTDKEEIQVDHIQKPDNEITQLTLSKTKKEKPSLWTALIPLATNPIYVCIVGVSCIYGAIVGALTFWVPSYLLARLANYHELSKAQQIALVSLGFSIISFIMSLLGTAFGAWVVEKTGGVQGWKGIARTMFWCVAFFLVSIPFGMIAFSIEDIPYWMIFALLGGAMFFVFCASSPFQVALINTC
jgi:MFS family permease